MFGLINRFLNKNKQPESIPQKIDFIIANKISLDYIMGKEFRLNNKNIIDDTELINIINEKDMQITRIYELSNFKQDTIKFKYWFTYNNRIIRDKEEVFYKWLLAYKELYIKYDLGIKDPSSGFYNINANKMKPYIINIENVIKFLLETYYKEAE